MNSVFKKGQEQKRNSSVNLNRKCFRKRMRALVETVRVEKEKTTRGRLFCFFQLVFTLFKIH